MKIQCYKTRVRITLTPKQWFKVREAMAVFCNTCVDDMGDAWKPVVKVCEKLLAHPEIDMDKHKQMEDV